MLRDDPAGGLAWRSLHAPAELGTRNDECYANGSPPIRPPDRAADHPASQQRARRVSGDSRCRDREGDGRFRSQLAGRLAANRTRQPIPPGIACNDGRDRTRLLATGAVREAAEVRRGSVSIGAALAEARQRAGLTVAQVSERTRISETVIRGIEREDYSGCGGDFYARGHIRGIATAVGADPGPLVEEYDAECRSPDVLSAVSLEELLATSARAPQRRRPVRPAVPGLIGAARSSLRPSRPGPASRTWDHSGAIRQRRIPRYRQCRHGRRPRSPPRHLVPAAAAIPRWPAGRSRRRTRSPS